MAKGKNKVNEQREIYQQLSLLRMSVSAIRQQINDQLDALEFEIARLIPEKEGRGRRKYTPREMSQIIKDACNRNKQNHSKRTNNRSGRKKAGRVKRD